MTAPQEDRYAISPPWFLGLLGVFAFGLPVLAVALRPHDTAARLALLVGLLVIVLTAVLMRRGVLRLRLAGGPPGSPVLAVLPAVCYFLGADAAGRSHGFATRVAAGAVVATAAGVLVGVVSTRHRMSRTRRRQ